MQKNYCYLNGKILPIEEAMISPDDLGILRGYGVFDAMITCNGKIFLFDEHYERFKNSSASLGLKLPAGKEEFKKIIDDLIDKNGLKKAAIRAVLTGGRSDNAMFFDTATPTFYVLAKEFKPLAKEFFESGAKMITVGYARMMPETKTLNYTVATKIMNERKNKEDFLEILYVSGGRVLEASTSNFFIFEGDRLITSKNGVLGGTTRNLIIKLAKKDFEIEERDLAVGELKTSSEAFITSTYKDITPIVQIDGFKIGDGKPGKNTKRLMEIFDEFVRNY